MLDERMLSQARDVLGLYRDLGWRLATAESCTGGLIAAALTAIPGSSDVIERGFVPYSNTAKTDLLGVPETLFTKVGAVSEAVAAAMAEGAVASSPVDAAVAVTGVAGPAGGTDAKPVGLVYIGVATHDSIARVVEHRFDGDRDAVRREGARAGLDMLADAARADGG